MEKIIEIIKESAVRTIKSGASGDQVARILAEKFGNRLARLIMIDISIDLGMNDLAKEYLARF